MADPLADEETVIVGPDDQLVIRISPDRIRSLAEFDEFVARVKQAFPDSRHPVVVVADQLAVQRPGESIT